jgi:hypothetical protein
MEIAHNIGRTGEQSNKLQVRKGFTVVQRQYCLHVSLRVATPAARRLFLSFKLTPVCCHFMFQPEPADLMSSIAAALAGCKCLMRQLQLDVELQRLSLGQPLRESATSLVTFAHSVLTLFNGIIAVWPIVSWQYRNLAVLASTCL